MNNKIMGEYKTEIKFINHLLKCGRFPLTQQSDTSNRESVKYCHISFNFDFKDDKKTDLEIATDNYFQNYQEKRKKYCNKKEMEEIMGCENAYQKKKFWDNGYFTIVFITKENQDAFEDEGLNMENKNSSKEEKENKYYVRYYIQSKRLWQRITESSGKSMTVQFPDNFNHYQAFIQIISRLDLDVLITDYGRNAGYSMAQYCAPQNQIELLKLMLLTGYIKFRTVLAVDQE